MEVVIRQGLFYVFFIPSTWNNMGNSLEMEKCMWNQSNHGSGWTKREKKKPCGVIWCGKAWEAQRSKGNTKEIIIKYNETIIFFQMFPFYKMHHLPRNREQILRRQAFFQATMMLKDEGTGCKVIHLVSCWVFFFFSLLFHWNNTLVNLNSLFMKAFPYFVIRPSLLSLPGFWKSEKCHYLQSCRK